MARHPAGTRHGASGPVQNKIYIIAGLVVLAVIAAVIFGFNPFRRDDNGTGPDPNGLTALDANAFDAVGPEVNEIEVPGPEYAVDNEPDTNSAEVVPDVTMMTESKAAELIVEAMGLLRGSPWLPPQCYALSLWFPQTA